MQDGWNWYVYAVNNPLKYVDPNGNFVMAIDISADAGVLTFGVEGGVLFAADSRGYVARFKHLGYEAKAGASAGINSELVVSPTMDSVERLEGWTKIISGDIGFGNASYGWTNSGEKLISSGVSVGKSLLPVEGSVSADYTFAYDYLKEASPSWNSVGHGIYYRYDSGVMIMKNTTAGKVYKMTNDTLRIYQLNEEGDIGELQKEIEQ